MPENISMEEFLALEPEIKKEEEKDENIISQEEFLALEEPTGNVISKEEFLALGSEDFSSELPEITSEVTALGEKQGIQRLNKMFKGLGWNFKELPYLEGGFGLDRVVAIAPPDAEGNRKEQMFEFDRGRVICPLSFF